MECTPPSRDTDEACIRSTPLSRTYIPEPLRVNSFKGGAPGIENDQIRIWKSYNPRGSPSSLIRGHSVDTDPEKTSLIQLIIARHRSPGAVPDNSVVPPIIAV
jgi:hypothetical protein